MLKPRDIANKSFERASRGYKFEDVDIFMSEITVAYTELYETNQQLEQQLEVLAEKIEEYRESEDSLRSVLLGAQKLGDSIVRESRAKAEVLTQEANAKAEAIVAAAIEKSKGILIDNENRIAKEQAELDSLRRDVAAFKQDLLSLYRRHFELIAEIPDYEGDEELEEKEVPAESFAPDVEEPAKVMVEEAAEVEEAPAFAVSDEAEKQEPSEETAEMDFDSVAKEYDFSGLKFQFTDEIDKRKS
ncbi:MAG: DivIVA domain-containing protein [Ruminococcaceae bacterium]|nr:DivIVA domain-containing protein [Oscillospiraceae bacterium]